MKNAKNNLTARRVFTAQVWDLLRAFSCLAILLLALPSNAANVAFSFTNAILNVPDTNYFKVYYAGTNNPAQADGTVLTIGTPIKITPNADGRCTNSIGAGFFLVTNAFLGRGFVIQVPNDNGPQVYQATDLMRSGLNNFVTITQTSTPPTFNQITNALGYTPANSANPVNTNAFVLKTNGYALTPELGILNGDTSADIYVTNHTAAGNGASLWTPAGSAIEMRHYIRMHVNSDETGDPQELYFDSDAFQLWNFPGINQVFDIQMTNGNATVFGGLKVVGSVTNGGAFYGNGSGLTNLSASANGFATGTALTNLAGTVATNATNFALTIGANATNNGTVVSNGVVTFAKAIGANDTNYANGLYLSATNYATTNTAAQVAALTLGNTNGLPSIYTTNNLGVTNGGSAGVNGTYVWSGSAYTNVFSTTYAITNTGGSWYVISNGTAIYSASSPAATWSIVSGASPAPSSAYGRYVPSDGLVFRGVVYSTNLTAQMSSAVGLVGLNATNNGTVVSNGAVAYANAVGLAGTNNATSISNALITFANAIGLNATNKANGNGTATTNFVNTTVAPLLLASNGVATNLQTRPTLTAGVPYSQRWFDIDNNMRGYFGTNGQFVSWVSTNFVFAEFSGDAHFNTFTADGDTTFNGSSTFNNGFLLPAIAGSQTGILMIKPDGSLDSTYFTPADAGNLTNVPAGQLTGSIADARLSSNVPLKNGNNVFTASNNFQDIRVAALYVTGAMNGNAASLTNYNGANIQTGTINSNAFTPATSNLLFAARALPSITVTNALTNYGDTYLTNLANASQPAMLYVKPVSDSNPGKVATLVANGSATSFIDGGFNLSSTIDVSMLPLRLKILETNNGSAITNLNASALAIGQVPTARATWAAPATNATLRGTVLLTKFFSVLDANEWFDLGDGVRIPTWADGDGLGLHLYSVGGNIGISASDFIISNHVSVLGNTDITGTVTATNFAGNGASLTNLNGTKIQSATINSNSFDGPTLALFGMGAGATNAVSSLNSMSNALTLTYTNTLGSTNGIYSIASNAPGVLLIKNSVTTNVPTLNGTNVLTGTNTFNGPLNFSTNVIVQSVPVSGAVKLYLSPSNSANTIALCIGPTNNAIASVLAWEDSDDPNAAFLYRAAGTHDLLFDVGGGDKMALRSAGTVNFTASNITLDDSGNMEITGKLTADGTVDPPGFLYDPNTRAGAKARDLLEVPDAVTNIYWIGLIGTNNTHRLLSNEVFSTVIRTNDLGRSATYTNIVNTPLVTFLSSHPNAFNGLIARTNVQPSKLTGMFVYNLDAIPRLEQYRASDDTYWTMTGVQITNTLPTTNQVISAMQSIIAAKQAKAALLQ